MNTQLPEQFVGSRIDKALSDYFSLSRNFFHQLFERNLIKGIVGGKQKIFKKSYTLEGGEELILPDLQRYENKQILAESPDIDLEVKLETLDYMVIYKPKGVLSHPKTLFDVSEPSVVGFLYHRFGQLPDGGNLIKAGLIHRLDKDTDGLMIIAKSEKGLSYFKDLFDRKSHHAVEGNMEEVVPLHKYYRAVCELTKQGEAWLHSHPQAHTLSSMIQPKVNVFGYPKLGITKVLKHTISSAKTWSHYSDIQTVTLELEILTGRTHQIRVQLSEIGLPILGDYLYHPASPKDSPLMLTAFKLEFTDCDNKKQCIELDTL